MGQVYSDNQNQAPQFAQQNNFAPYTQYAPRPSGSRLWFAALIPLLSMLIEVYADCFALGVVVWCGCFVSWTAACLADRHYLRSLGVDISGLNPLYAILPPLYIFKRTALTRTQNTPAIVFIIMAFYAACANGFTQGALMDDERLISQVRDNLWANIQNVGRLSGADTAGYIGETIDSAAEQLGASGEAEWEAVRKGDVITVTVKRGEFEIVFKEVFDGFTFTELSVVSYKDSSGRQEYKPDGDNTVFEKYFTTFFGSASDKLKKSKKSDYSEVSQASLSEK